MNPLRSTFPAARLLPIAAALNPGFLPAAKIPIGVSFAENPAFQLDAGETAGAPGFEHSNWNNLGRWGNPSPLHDGTGVETPVTIKWDATGLWENDADPSLGGNHKLMKGYLDSNGQAISSPFDGVFGASDDKPTALVTGLDAWLAEKGLTSYSVIVYSDGDSDGGDRAARVWLAGTLPDDPINGDPGLGVDLTARVDITDASNWGANPVFTRVSGAGGTGNHTVFTGLTAASFYLRVDEAGSNPWRAPINGIQIVGTDTPLDVDTDGDGLPDAWEINFGLDPEDDGSTDEDNGADGDPDSDGRSNLQEYQDGTSPRLADTDGDGLDDGAEAIAGTDPLDPDTDGDELPDGWEVQYGLDPLDDGSTDENNGKYGDPDGEQLQNYQEYEAGTDPTNPDTDGDGYDDWAEDGSGVWSSETLTGTDPTNPDTDGDGIPDGAENPYAEPIPGVLLATDPNKADTDGDGQNDRWEDLLGTDPADGNSHLTIIPLVNASFEQPDAAGAFVTGVPTGWSIANPIETDEAFVENLASVNITGGEGAQYAGIQDIGNYLYQDTGVPFAANTTYIVDLAGGYRNNYNTGVVEYGLYSSTALGSPVAGYPGSMDLDGVRRESGNPDADGKINTLRDATILAGIGSGSLGRPYVLVTGDNPPAGNIVAYIRHASGFRVCFDNIRVFSVPNATDGDGDGLPDGWELASNLSPRDNGDTDAINGPAGDPDEDGSPNAQELARGTNPRSEDTDNDGLSDGAETGTGTFVDADDTGSNPLLADTDGDGLLDGVELSLGTNPNLADTDGDGFSDGAENLAGTDPLDPDDFPDAVAAPTITSFGFNGAVWELTAGNLSPGKSYTLTRSADLTGFSPVGAPVTGVSSHTFSDDSPPAGSAFYRVEETEEP